MTAAVRKIDSTLAYYIKKKQCCDLRYVCNLRLGLVSDAVVLFFPAFQSLLRLSI